MEEKEAWLRARGVEIESPAERKGAAEAAAARQAAHPLDHVEGITRRVKYVRIPADESQPFEQLEAILANDAHGDILPDVLAPTFSGGGSIDRRAAREQAVRQLGEKGLELSQDAASITPPNRAPPRPSPSFDPPPPTTTAASTSTSTKSDSSRASRPTRGPTPSRDLRLRRGVLLRRHVRGFHPSRTLPDGQRRFHRRRARL